MKSLLQHIRSGMGTGLVALVTACGPEMNVPSVDNGSNPSQDATQTTDVYTPQPDAGFYDATFVPDATTPYDGGMPKPDARVDSGMYDAGMAHPDARTNMDAMPTLTDSGVGTPPVCAPNLLNQYERAIRQSLGLNLGTQPCNCSADPPLGSTGNPEMRMYRAEWGDGSWNQDPDGLVFHPYIRSGNFQVIVYCTNTDGLTSTKQTTVIVQ